MKVKKTTKHYLSPQNHGKKLKEPLPWWSNLRLQLNVNAHRVLISRIISRILGELSHFSLPIPPQHSSIRSLLYPTSMY